MILFRVSRCHVHVNDFHFPSFPSLNSFCFNILYKVYKIYLLLSMFINSPLTNKLFLQLNLPKWQFNDVYEHTSKRYTNFFYFYQNHTSFSLQFKHIHTFLKTIEKRKLNMRIGLIYLDLSISLLQRILMTDLILLLIL